MHDEGSMSDRIKFFRYEELDEGVQYKATVGGKGANLLEMASQGFPVPEGFVITTDAYREFLEGHRLDERLADLAEEDLTEQSARERFQGAATQLIIDADLPDEIRADIVAAYDELGEEAIVAVRSSGSAEDLADASFAGQLETYLNIQGRDDVVEHVKRCWASLFTQRAVLYRAEREFDVVDTDIAVVVQRMVDADASGVLFTADPTTGEDVKTIEASWGLGEAIVGGAVTPDKYVVRDGEIVETVVNEKTVMYTKDPDTGETNEQAVPQAKRSEQVLSRDDVLRLVEIGENLSESFGQPQDIEWAMVDGEIYLLQTRPITTISEEESDTRDEATGQVIAEGLGVSSGTAHGRICLTPIQAIKRDKEGQDVILVRKRTSPSDMHGIKAAEGILTTQGGTTSHAAIVAREMDKPAIVGCDRVGIDEEGECIEVDGERYEVGDLITIDGERGTVLVE